MNKFNHFKSLTLSLSLMLAGSVYAEQQLQADESRQLEAVISSTALTRISIEGGRIVNVRFLDGELDLQKDEISGQVYVKPLSTKSKITLFVTGDSNKTYLLGLKPTGKQADSIVIQERSAQTSQLRQMEQMQARIPQSVSTKEDSYTRSIKAFLIAIANNNTAGFGVQVTPSYAEVPLWKEVLFIRKNRYAAADLYGESYTLTNITRQSLVLSEQEFFKSRVLAVAIRKLVLNPGEQTDVYVVNSGGQQQ